MAEQEKTNYEKQSDDAARMGELMREREKKICEEIKRRDPGATITMIHDSIDIQTSLTAAELEEIRGNTP